MRTFAAEAARLGARKAIAERLVEGRALPGFGHLLYPDGDPRALALLAPSIRRRAAPNCAKRFWRSPACAPNVDFALMAPARPCDLPPDAPFALFAVARCAGWIAHAIEQVQTGTSSARAPATSARRSV